MTPGTAPGLYGGSGSAGICDAGKLVAFLTSHPAKASAWASVLGVSVRGISDYVASLTPVVLTADTLVVNHGFRGGGATTEVSILQAGTAVMVDPKGVPRVKCNCGNPLTQPQPIDLRSADLTGPGWNGYSPTAVAVVHPGAAATSLVVIDVNTGKTYALPTSAQAPATTTTTAAPSTTTAASPQPVPSTTIGGDYDVTFGTSGAVVVHQSTTGHYTISVKTAFKLVGSTCSLPVSTVLATFSGQPPRFTGRLSRFDPTTCAFFESDNRFTVTVNTDGTLTSSYDATGESHLFVNTAPESTSTAPVAGDFQVRYATAGQVTVHPPAGGVYTVSVKTPFKLVGSTCNLPATTVISVFSGSSPDFTGKLSRFDPTTCAFVESDNRYSVTLNTDGTLTSTYDATGESHLLTRL